MKNPLIKTALSLILGNSIAATEAANIRLEKVYLLNALLYMPNSNDHLTFASINKKCRDVLMMKKRHTVNIYDRASLKIADSYTINTLDFVNHDIFKIQRTLQRFKNKSNITALDIHFKPSIENTESYKNKKDAPVILCNFLKELNQSGYNNLFTIYLRNIDYDVALEIHRALHLKETRDGYCSCVINGLPYQIKLTQVLLLDDNRKSEYEFDEDDDIDFDTVNAFKQLNELSIKAHTESLLINENEYDKINEICEGKIEEVLAVKRIGTSIKKSKDEKFNRMNDLYEKYYAPAMSFDEDEDKDLYTCKELFDNDLVRINKRGSVNLVKWDLGLQPRGFYRFPISAKEALQRKRLDLSLDDFSLIDITDVNDYAELKDLVNLHYETYIRHLNDRIYALKISNHTIYSNMKLEPGFFDKFFDYTHSEIVLDTRFTGGWFIPPDVGGRITFLTPDNPDSVQQWIHNHAFSRIHNVDENPNSIDLNRPLWCSPIKVEKKTLRLSALKAADKTENLECLDTGTPPDELSEEQER